jgi:hypothetical protein
MFNLVMRGADWSSGRETMPANRVFEYTEDYVADQFRRDGQLLLDKLITLPCLFMAEGIDDELAYVGRINQARLAGGEVSFEYTLRVDRFRTCDRVALYSDHHTVSIRVFAKRSR